HKVAIAPIAAGEVVLRYAEVIGRARTTIAPGDHVHTHNVGYEEFESTYQFPTTEIPYPETLEPLPRILAYPRAGGRVGTRNYIAVVAASNCASHTASLIANAFPQDALP